jgi:deazaflavin-dependent oxidoreductase (nitroreductase family)
LGSWYFSKTQHYVDHFFFKLTNERATLTSMLSGLPVVMLTTKGAKSGLYRSTPLLGMPSTSEEGLFFIVASNWGQQHYPAWYFNLKANPSAICTIKGKTGEYIACEASGEEYNRLWEQATNTYPGFPLYKQRATERNIPIMVMTPKAG